MQIEYEATFVNVNKDEIRKRLQNIGAKLEKPEFLQKRFAFDFPTGHEVEGGWLRVRDEKDKITMTLKVIDGNKIENQKEINIVVDDFERAKEFLILVGCKIKSYQETKREIWKINQTEICIDEWPFLEPFVEIEGDSEKAVMDVAHKLGFNYRDAVFCGVATLYSKRYGISYDIVNKDIPKITFEMENPFLKFIN